MSPKRFRISTLMLLVVIAALSIALLEQGRRAARREAELRARIAELDMWRDRSAKRESNLESIIKDLRDSRK